MKKKLEIKKVTLRNLDSAEMTNIAGGSFLVWNCASQEECPTSAATGGNGWSSDSRHADGTGTRDGPD